MSNKQIDISVVIPVYGCDESLIDLYNRLTSVLKGIVKSYEIIFVDDCGIGNPWKIIKEISINDNSVHGLKLSRNFGQHAAIIAGLEKSIGDWIVVMDCDLQDRPEEIIKLYDTSQKSVDIVFAQRVDRRDSFFKRVSSKLFYKVLGYLTDTKLDASIANFGIYSRKVIDAVLSMKETHKILPIMVRWVGFSSISVKVKHAARRHSASSYTFIKLIRLSLDIVISFSDKPLRLIIKVGFFISFLSGVYAIKIIYFALVNSISVLGWASMMVSMWFIGGLLVSIIGVVGLYVGKNFDETKFRPVYIIDECI
jgi:dolichol-phosphate mannosyltransferase